MVKIAHHHLTLAQSSYFIFSPSQFGFPCCFALWGRFWLLQLNISLICFYGENVLQILPHTKLPHKVKQWQMDLKGFLDQLLSQGSHLGRVWDKAKMSSPALKHLKGSDRMKTYKSASIRKYNQITGIHSGKQTIPKHVQICTGWFSPMTNRPDTAPAT